MHLNVFVSQRCFLYCKGCYSFSREEKYGQELSTDKIIEFLKYVYSKEIKKVTLCGGDPLTRLDILELLHKIKKIGFYISLDTVGTSIIKNVERSGSVVIKKIDAKKISKYVDIIGIPVDGSSNEIFKLFRQTSTDIINEQLSICKELHKYGANICINTVVHKGNLEDAYEISKMIKKIDYINKWQIFRFSPLGKYGYKNRKLFEIDDKEFLEFKSKVLEIFENDSGKLQFKDFSVRNKSYMLIDNSGNAWVPSFESNNLDCSINNIENRNIVGSITNYKDWDKICSYLIKDNIKI